MYVSGLAAVQILLHVCRPSLSFVVFLSPGTHLFVVLFVLIVEICLQRQLGATVDTLEATGMKECEILEWPHAIHLIDGLAAAQAGGLVEIWTIHCGERETTTTMMMLLLLLLLPLVVANSCCCCFY